MMGAQGAIKPVAEVLTEAWMNRANIAGYAWEHFPALIETINIAAVSTLFGSIAAAFLALSLPVLRWLAPMPGREEGRI